MEDIRSEYLAHVESTPEQVVDCIPPSRFVFKFVKPSKYAMLFRAGQLPQTAASEAVTAWQAKGLLPEGVELSDKEVDQVRHAEVALAMRDKVLELSRVPKLVVGEAKNPGELSTDDITDEDLDYIFKWVAAGGNESMMLSKFPGRPEQRPLASASRKKQRTKAESNGGG